MEKVKLEEVGKSIKPPIGIMEYLMRNIGMSFLEYPKIKLCGVGII